MGDAEEFATHFETLKLDDDTLAIGHSQTIVPASMQTASEPVDAVRTLPRMSMGSQARTEDESHPDLELVGTLGEGGMGLVRLATQVALRRNVAVKTLRSGSGSAPKLLQEAYVTGRLEHPNIIPIYTLGRDDDGTPLIVMKRIEGVSWLEILRDSSLAPTGVEPDLAWHLEILLQVCNGLRYAHSRAIVHRDIKPENVMIGPFGEVYLLDWGIAISIADDAEDTALPHRSAVHGMAGTPAYMAPEMTFDDASEVDERSDIYLLGATLHELLTGTTRHTGKNLFEVMRSAFESDPIAYGDDVPTDLAAVANQATSQEKDDRFQTVEEFQQAIFDHLDHRASYELAAEAQHLIARLRPLALRRGTDRTDDDEIEIRDLLSECRFACRQALKSWPQNETALDALRQYRELAFHNAVRLQDTLTAQSMLRELEADGDAREDLRRELATLSSFLDSERKEFEGLREFAAELDMSRGRVSRSLAVLLLGVLWTATVVFAWYRTTYGDLDLAENHIASGPRSVMIGLLALFLFRKKLLATAGNRRIAYLLIVTLLAIGSSRIIAYLHPDAVESLRTAEVVLYAMSASASGIASDDLRIALLGLVYLPVALAGPFIGNDALLLVAAAHATFLGGMAWFWTPRQIRNRWRV